MGQKLVRYSLIPAIQLSSYLKSKFVSLTGISLMTSDLAICQTECDIGMRIAMVEVCYPLLLSKQQTNMVRAAAIDCQPGPCKTKYCALRIMTARIC